MSNGKLYLRIDRTDGSRTYKGPWVHSHVSREMDAWREAFPDYRCELLDVPEARPDVRKWTKATRDGNRYYPEA